APARVSAASAPPAGGDGVARTVPTSLPDDEADIDDGPIEGAEEDRLVEERRVVTVVFADIVGFTTLSERLDPEDVRELSATVLGRLAEAITLYGGTIDKFM